MPASVSDEGAEVLRDPAEAEGSAATASTGLTVSLVSVPVVLEAGADPLGNTCQCSAPLPSDWTVIDSRYLPAVDPGAGCETRRVIAVFDLNLSVREHVTEMASTTHVHIPLTGNDALGDGWTVKLGKLCVSDVDADIRAAREIDDPLGRRPVHWSNVCAVWMVSAIGPPPC